MDKEELKRQFIQDYRNSYIHIGNNNLLYKEDIIPHSTFWEWFEKQSILYLENDVEWNNIHENNIKKNPGLCHHNSLLNASMYKYSLFCGLVIQNPAIVVHSYNVYEGKVYDFTYYFNQEMASFRFSNFPFKYLGVNISKEYILKVSQMIATKEKESYDELYGSNSPLIYPYYLFCIGNSQWATMTEELIEIISTKM